MTVVVTPSARERFTPRELGALRTRTIHRTRAAIRERPNRPQSRCVQVRCRCAHRLRGARVGRGDAGNARGAGGGREGKRGVSRNAPPAPRFTLPIAAGRVLTNSTSRNSTRRRGVQ